LKELGANMLAFLCWCAHRRNVREAIVLHENVGPFTVDLFNACLSDLYVIFSEVFDFAILGFAVHRVRRLTVMIRQDLLGAVLFPYDLFITACRRNCRWTLHESLRASDGELATNLSWAENRDKSMAELSVDACRLAILDGCSVNDYGDKAADVYALAQTSRHTRSLVPSECLGLHMYRDMATSAVAGAFPLRYLSCFPGQDPITHPQVSFSQNLGTIIKSAAIVRADGGEAAIMRYVTCRGLLLV
jgi:hypothetical protein